VSFNLFVRWSVVRLTVVIGSLALIGASVAGPWAHAEAPFIPGTATGTAQAFAIAPKTGGFAYTITGGSTVADFRGSLAQAESQSLDFGLIGTSLTTQQCDGSDPPIQRSQLPQPLIAESDKGNAHKSADSAGTAQHGVLAVGGHMTVSAEIKPKSSATFDGTALSIPGVLDATGLSSAAAAELIPNTARLASAEARVGRLSLAGGLVVLTNVHWAADQRSGTHAAAKHAFSIGHVAVAGKSLPASSDALGSTFAAVNKALAPTGLHVTIPTGKRTSGDGIAVPPLSVGIDKSALGGAVLNPVLTAAGPARDKVINTLLGISCKFGSPLTLGDILLSALNGTGSLDLQFGGVTAGSEGKAYASPFGSVGQAPLPTTNTTSQPSGRGTAAAAPPSAGRLPSASTATSPAAPAPQLAGAQTHTESCASTSPANWPSCSNGAALAAGLIGLVAVGSVGGADWLVTRRRRRLPELDI
jgi:hypothetical protein